jgi:hypothetical protein
MSTPTPPGAPTSGIARFCRAERVGFGVTILAGNAPGQESPTQSFNSVGLDLTADHAKPATLDLNLDFEHAVFYFSDSVGVVVEAIAFDGMLYQTGQLCH